MELTPLSDFANYNRAKEALSAMNIREITIGRDRRCDIFLDAACQYASKVHGTIYFDGKVLMFKDVSTNGTYINNVKVHHRAVPIRRGDTIMLAGQYPLSWQQIDQFFPPSDRTIVSPSSASTVVDFAKPNVAVAEPSANAQPDLSKWNWGAFLMGWLWGFFNGCWWIFLVEFVLSFTGIGLVVFRIVAGVKGTQWAWNNRSWNSVEDFEHTQRNWTVAGLCVFCFSIIGSLIFFLFFFTALESATKF